MGRWVMSRALVLLGAAFLLAWGRAGLAGGQAGPITRERFIVTQHADAVVIYVRDLDLLRQEHTSLRAGIRLAGGAEQPPQTVDLSAAWQPPAIVLEKKEPRPCAAVALTIYGDGRLLFREEIQLGSTVEAQPVLPLTDQKAFIEPGTHMGKAPEIVQPDLGRLPEIKLGEAERKVEAEGIAARVTCDMNYPLISAQNNCAISRQTAHPADPAHRSVYVPLKSQTYDHTTGIAGKVIHYLAEVPLKPEWLEGAGDLAVSVPAEEVKLHTSDIKVGGTVLLGEGMGGLGQLTGSVAVDNAGNIYYSQLPPVVARFNIAKGTYEYPPVNILQHFADRLPKPEALPESIRRKNTRILWESYCMIAAGGGRLFVVPVINAAYVQPESATVVFSGILSMPLDDWDNPEKFKAGLRFHAGSWPGEKTTLYDTFPDPTDRRRRIGSIFASGNSLYLESYPGAHGGPWKLDLGPDSNTVAFGVTDARTLAQARASAGAGQLRTSAAGAIDWWDYGLLTTTRRSLKQLLTGRDDPTAQGKVTIYYDAIAAARLDAKRYSGILDSVKGPSLAPCWMATHVPDLPGHVLGVGEYGYYLALLDVRTAEQGTVKKTYLQLDVGDSPVTLPLKLGLGPYAHLWKQEGNRRLLYVGGYTGLTRLRFSEDGKPLGKYRMEPLMLPPKVLDKAGSGDIKRYQYLMHGLDDRIFMTGTHEAARAGTAYSGGLMSFKTTAPTAMEKLSYMSRVHWTFHTRGRILYSADGNPIQQLTLGAAIYDETYAWGMKETDLPQNKDQKIFVYDCRAGGQPRDLFGFSLPLLEGKSEYADQAFSPNGRFLVILLGTRLLTYDFAAQRYVDGKALIAADGGLEIWRFCKPDHRLLETPDGRLMLYAQPQKDKNSATFYEVDVSPEGLLSVKPWLTLKGKTPAAVATTNGAVIAFLRDAEKMDGSYDLFLGLYWRTPGTEVRLIRDFIPARR